MTTYPAKKLKRVEKPKPCTDCQVNLAEPPSKICPSCKEMARACCEAGYMTVAEYMAK